MRYLLTILLALALWHSVTASAANLTVSLRVGLSSFTISGYAAPGSMVTLQQNGVTAGTTTADVNGNFSKTIEALEPATYTFHTFSTDSEGKLSNALEYVVAIGDNQDLSLNNVLLPPTLTLDTLDTLVRTDVHLRGQSVPGATIHLFLADELMATYTAGSDGRWYGLISTTSRQAGEYHVYAHATHPLGYQSIPSIGYTLTLRPREGVTESPSFTIASQPRATEPDLSLSTRPTLAAPSQTIQTIIEEPPRQHLISLVLKDQVNHSLVWLSLLVIGLVVTFFIFFLIKRRRARDQKSTTTSPS